jgi:hypothetical protein
MRGYPPSAGLPLIRPGVGRDKETEIETGGPLMFIYSAYIGTVLPPSWLGGRPGNNQSGN